MNKGQQQKLLIGIICVVMLLCISIGALRYSASPQGKAKESTIHPAPPALPRSNERKVAPSSHPVPDRDHSTLSPKGTLWLWAALLLLSSSIASRAGYYLWRTGDITDLQDHNKYKSYYLKDHYNIDVVIQYIVALVSFLVFSLYMIPKCFNRIAVATLALEDTSPYWGKMARFIQHFTACWIHPNLDVICPTMVAAIGAMLYVSHQEWSKIPLVYQDKVKATINEISAFIKGTLIVSTIAYFLYGILEGFVYKFPNQKLLFSAIEHLISFAASILIILGAFKYKNNQTIQDILLPSFLCYILIVALVHTLLHNLDAKGYKRTPLHTLLTAPLSSAHDTRPPAD